MIFTGKQETSTSVLASVQRARDARHDARTGLKSPCPFCLRPLSFEMHGGRAYERCVVHGVAPIPRRVPSAKERQETTRRQDNRHRPRPRNIDFRSARGAGGPSR